MKTLYLNLLFYTACCLLLFSSCEIKDNTPCAAQYTYHHLTAEEKSKTPYFNNPNFDTISFASSTGDTLTFALQRIDSSWYIEDMNRNPNPDGCPDWHYYETRTVRYKELTTNALFIAILSKKNQTYPHTSITILLSGYSFLYGIDEIGLSNYIYYVGDISILNKTYHEALYEYHNAMSNTNIKGYLNKNQGFLGIKNQQSNLDFALIQ